MVANKNSAKIFNNEEEAEAYIKHNRSNFLTLGVLEVETKAVPVVAHGNPEPPTKQEIIDKTFNELVTATIQSTLSYFNSKAINTNVSVESMAWKSLAHHLQTVLDGYKEITKVDS